MAKRRLPRLALRQRIRPANSTLLKVLSVGEADAINVVEVGHVGEDDLVARLQTVQNFNCVDGGAAQFDGNPLGC